MLARRIAVLVEWLIVSMTMIPMFVWANSWPDKSYSWPSLSSQTNPPTDDNLYRKWMPASLVKSFYGDGAPTPRGGSTETIRVKPSRFPQQSHWDERQEDSEDRDDTDRSEKLNFADLIDSLESSEVDDDLDRTMRRELNDQLDESKLIEAEYEYRHFKRKRRRPDSIPFLIIGPSVDHWVRAAETLAGLGFRVFVIRRKSDSTQDGATQVATILDALGWKRAVVVGCDDDSRLVVEAAMDLGPERVAGLVLCGDMTTASQFVYDETRIQSQFGTDLYLETALECPFKIVWGGDGIPRSSDLTDNRSLIVGGGTAPHRRRPDELAWTLTRFVEEKIFSSKAHPTKQTVPNNAQNLLNKYNPFEQWIPSGSFLVTGRAVARIIFYAAVFRAGIIQYDNLSFAMGRIRTLLTPKTLLRPIVYLGRQLFFRPKGRRESAEDNSDSLEIARDSPSCTATEAEQVLRQEVDDQKMEHSNLSESRTQGGNVEESGKDDPPPAHTFSSWRLTDPVLV